MSPWIRNFPSTKYQRPSRRVDELVEVRATSCPENWKLSLTADELQVDQRHEDEETGMLLHYYVP